MAIILVVDEHRDDRADLLQRLKNEGYRIVATTPRSPSPEFLDALRTALAHGTVDGELHPSQSALAERTRLAELTSDIGKALLSGDGLSSVLQFCAETLVRQLDLSLVRLWTLDESGSRLLLRATAGRPFADPPRGTDLPVGSFLVGKAAADRRPRITQRLQEDPDFGDPEWAKRENIRGFAGIPLLIENRLAGMLALFSTEPFSELAQESFVCIADQISLGIERKRAEQRLLATQDRLEYLLRANPTVLFSLQMQEGEVRILWISENLQRVLGYSAAEAMAPGWWVEHIHPDDRPLALKHHSQIFRLGSLDQEYRFRHKDGSYRLLRDAQQVLREPGRQGDAIVGSLNDISERRRLEDQYRQAQKMEAIGSLAGGVAHDFNNLLTVISGYSELLLGQVAKEHPSRLLLGEIRKAGERAAGLTRQLLAFSRKQVMAPVLLDLNELISETQKMLHRLIGEDIELSLALARELGLVKADPGQLEQVIMNLVINARDALPRGGRVVLETKDRDIGSAFVKGHPGVPPGKYVVLTISDNGIGMDETVKSRIFEPFFTTKEAGRGTGLGLATVYGIVKQSEGHIGVDSEPAKGTSFHIYFPRFEDELPNRKSIPGLFKMPAGTETVLLVEDEDAVRKLARLTLQTNGYKVLEASNGNDALKFCEIYEDPIHLLITDVVMPMMSGRDLADKMMVENPKLRVMFLSGYLDDAMQRYGVAKEKTRFLQKPFTPAVLAQKVREVLDEKPL